MRLRIFTLVCMVSLGVQAADEMSLMKLDLEQTCYPNTARVNTIFMW